MPILTGVRNPPAPPVPQQTVGVTFLVAISLLGVIAAGQIAALLCLRHPVSSPVIAAAPAISGSIAAVKPSPSPAQELLTAEAEKRLLAAIPRPTPVAVRRIVTPEARVADLINLARTLRDRGDTSTALTRLREAQVISPQNWQIVSEMALTYEKMGLGDKALQQWRRIYEMGEQAGIYYAAAEAKMRAVEVPSTESPAPAPSLEEGLVPANLPGTSPGHVLSLGKVGTIDDTGNSQALRRLKLRIPIFAKPKSKIDVHDTMIQVCFYDQLPDHKVVETNANVASSWTSAPIDWATAEPEVLEVEYAQPEPDLHDPRSQERRNYYGYLVRVYYKNELNAVFADPEKLIQQFPPPATLPNSDLPQ